MEEKIVLSVIVPIYNGAMYIDRLIQMFLSQDFQKFEVIFVDDGSTDETLNKCRLYSERYSWIHVIHTENFGVSHARNKGLEKAKGYWIHFIDADDWIEKNMFSVFYEMAFKYGTDMILCSCSQKTESRERFCGPAENGKIDREGIRQLLNGLSMENRYWLLDYVWNRWYRRDILNTEKIRFRENVSKGEDFIFNTEYMKKITSAFFLKHAYYYYHISSYGLAGRFREKPWIEREELYEAQKKLYLSLDIWQQNEQWIQRQAGRIAFGDIRTVNNENCSYNWEQKKKFLSAMMQNEQYQFLLKYLEGEKRIRFWPYRAVLSLRRPFAAAVLIGLEGKMRKIIRYFNYRVNKV